MPSVKSQIAWEPVLLSQTSQATTLNRNRQNSENSPHRETTPLLFQAKKNNRNNSSHNTEENNDISLLSAATSVLGDIANYIRNSPTTTTTTRKFRRSASTGGVMDSTSAVSEYRKHDVTMSASSPDKTSAPSASGGGAGDASGGASYQQGGGGASSPGGNTGSSGGTGKQEGGHAPAQASGNGVSPPPPPSSEKKASSLPDGSSAPSMVLSIDEAIEMLGMGNFQRMILVAAGLCFAADSMEVLLLSFLAVVLKSEWGLTNEQTSAITSSVFIGALLGTLVLGPLGDKLGRKPVFSMTAALIAFFGIATAFADNFPTLLVYRFMVGFGVGGLTVPFDTLAEFVPDSERGSNLLLIEYFWTFGTLLVPLVALLSLGEGGADETENNWRWFVLWCAVPCLVSTLLGLLVVPESPRWLLTQGKRDKALDVLRKAARTNGHDPDQLFPLGTKIVQYHGDDDDDEIVQEEGTNFMELFSPRWLRITLNLWGTWAGFAFTYYGTIIAVTMVFSGDGKDEANENDQQGGYEFDYFAIFTSACAEVAGTTLGIFLLDRFGRVPAQVVAYLGGGVSVLALCLLANNGGSRSHKIITAFIARMFYMCGSCSSWVSAAEILTTEIRTTGHSAANAIARLSGSFSPYLVSNEHAYSTIGATLCTISIFTAFCAWHLPETKGRSMGDTADDAPPSTYHVASPKFDNESAVEIADHRKAASSTDVAGAADASKQTYGLL